MARDKLTEYSATASENTVCGDVNIAENSALPSDMNNFAREVMSHLKNFSDGTDAIDALTVTGDLTVDTNTLHVDASSDVVRVGKTSGGVTTDGWQLSAGASHYAIPSGQYFILNRTTSGAATMIDFRSENSSKGAISYNGTNVSFTSGSNNIFNQSGISFDNGSNYLDDYEEGTWTPTYDTGFPSGSPEEVNKGCKYTKIGNIVHVSGRIQARNDGTNMQLGGLPFAVASTSSASCDVSADFHTAKKERVYEGTSAIRWTFSSTTPSPHNFYFQATYRTA